MSLSLPTCPASLKSIQHYLKIASEHETRDPVITYWARITALQNGLSIDKSSKEALAVLLPLMDWLEKEKVDKKEQEAISNEVRCCRYYPHSVSLKYCFLIRSWPRLMWRTTP